MKNYLVLLRNKLFGVNAILQAIEELKTELRVRENQQINQEISEKTKERSLIPDTYLVEIGDGEFVQIGEEFFNYFIKYGDLKPDYRVLDIGSGMGRMAFPLTKYLSNQGEYWGIDVAKDGINWCQERYPKQYPNFNFKVADIYNKMYNPTGQYKSSEYKFTYEDSYFDFIFLTSVFTHMYLPDIEHYLSEISRMLKPGKKCLITYFLLNNESLQNVNEGISNVKFLYEIEGGLTTNKDEPENAIGIKEDLILNIYKKLPLTIDKIFHGKWSGKQNCLSYQDIIVATKSE